MRTIVHHSLDVLRGAVVLVLAVLASAASAGTTAIAPSAIAPSAAATSVKIFMPAVRARDIDRAFVDVLMVRLTQAARRHEHFSVVTQSELRTVVDLEAERQASGCDDSSESCIAEIAEALDAPQLVVAEVVHAKDRWLLTLTRTDRRSLHVLRQVTREARGEAPDALLDVVGPAVDELLGPPTSPLFTAGVVSGGAGALLGGCALGAWALSWIAYFTAVDQAKQAPDVAKATIANGKTALAIAPILGLVGGVLAVSGGALVAVGAASTPVEQ